MQEVIDRKVYDTESAEELAQYGHMVDKSDFHALEETLYKTADGEYFLHGRGGAQTKWGKKTRNGRTYGEEIQVFTNEEALDWFEKRSVNPEVAIEEFADLIDGADDDK